MFGMGWTRLEHWRLLVSILEGQRGCTTKDDISSLRASSSYFYFIFNTAYFLDSSTRSFNFLLLLPIFLFLFLFVLADACKSPALFSHASSLFFISFLLFLWRLFWCRWLWLWLWVGLGLFLEDKEGYYSDYCFGSFFWARTSCSC